MPFESSWGPIKLLLATQIFLRDLALAIFPHPNQLLVPAEIYALRYALLVTTPPQIACARVEPCPARDTAAHHDLSVLFLPAIKNLTTLFASHGEQLASAVPEIYYANFAEKLVFAVLGMEVLVGFLAECLRFSPI